jgi:hypothetical protein
MKNVMSIALAALGLVAGCASTAVSDDIIITRTSFALGLAPSEFAITNRTNSGVRSDYIATTKTNRVYQCYVAGSVSVTGKVVSDAICSPMSGKTTQEQSQPAASGQPCNALLKAAKKCSY